MVLNKWIRTGFSIAVLLAATGVGTAHAAGPATPMAADRAFAFVDQNHGGGACNGGVTSSILPQLAARASGSNAVGAAAAGPQIGAMCALPFKKGKLDVDCQSENTIVYSTVGTGPGAKLVAEILVLDGGGNLIQAVPVENGGNLKVKSTDNPKDFKVRVKDHKPEGKPTDYEIFAPIMLLHIAVEDQGQKAEAFCSNLPYMQVMSPTGGVVAGGDSNDTNVLVAIPRVDPNSVELRVDDVNLFDALGITAPSNCTASSPCGGAANVNGNVVQVSNLIVDGTSNIEILSSNTVRATVSDLSCGTHLYSFVGEQPPFILKAPHPPHPHPKPPLPPPPYTVKGHLPEWCHLDDLYATASSSVFGIELDTPAEGSVVPAGPALVEGKVCGGNQIVNVKLNGMNLNLAGETFNPGDGVTSGALYTVPISTTLGETDLVQDIKTGDAPLGTFDAGSNRLAASATDDLGNRAFAQRVFATGAVAPVAVDLALAATFRGDTLSDTFSGLLKDALSPKVADVVTATTTDIENAFVVGLSANGAQKLFTQLCTAPNPNATIKDSGGHDIPNPAFGKTPGQLFKEKIEAALLAHGPSNPIKTGSVPVVCACDPPYKIFIDSVSVGTDVSCPVTFTDGSFHVAVQLPVVHVVAKATGSCEEDFLGVCVDAADVNVTATADITNIKLDFDVTEGNLLNSTTSTPVFNTGATVDLGTTGGVDVSCIGGDICEIGLTILTLGTVDFSPEIDISKTLDFSKQVGAGEPDPVKLKDIKVDEEVVANFDQKLSGNVSSVKITPSGITAGLTGHFATTAVDPDVPSTPGAVLTPAPVPTLPVPNAKDVFIGLADDSINMLFASMTAAGKLKLGCVDTTKTIGDLLPDCDTLTLDTPAATAAARGMCYGVRGNNCETFSFTNAALTATGQGICHGVKGDTCSSIPTTFGTALVEQTACNVTPNFNLHATQSLLFCTQEDIPPRMLFAGGDAVSSSVPASLRLNDLSVALIVDRDGTPGFPPTGGVLADAQGCFKQGGDTTKDCNLLAACLDINLNFNLGFQTCADGKPGFRSHFDNIQILNREPGMVCGGSGAPTSDSLALNQTSSDDTVTIQIGQQAADLSPDICGAGLNLGGFVTCQSPQLLAIEAGGSPDLKDYLAITCNVQ